MSQTRELIRLIDAQGYEHFLNPAAIADARVTRTASGLLEITIVTTAPAGSAHEAGQAQVLRVAGEHAFALRRQLCQRAGIPEDTELPEPAPATRLPQPTQRPPAFLTKR